MASAASTACSACARIAAGAVDQPGRQPFRVVEQDFEQMFGGELLVALAQGQRLRGLHETAGAVGVFLEIHVSLPRPMMAPVENAGSPKAARLDAIYVGTLIAV